MNLICSRSFFGKIARGLALIVFSVTAAGPARASEDLSELARFDPSSTLVVDHSVWDTLLDIYVTPGTDGINRFDYGRVSTEDKQALEGYIRQLEAIDISRYKRDEQFAFWANLYNAVTINLVVDAYPVSSIRKIKSGAFSTGPWSKKRIRLRGRALSLDDVEHKILRAFWDDPRVHYALNCASLGCPNLPLRAFTAQTLSQALDAGARAYINHPRGAHLDNGKLTVSSIYHWYREDFGNSDQGVIDHLRQYAQGSLKQDLAQVHKISDHSYDWSLNDVASR